MPTLWHHCQTFCQNHDTRSGLPGMSCSCCSKTLSCFLCKGAAQSVQDSLQEHTLKSATARWWAAASILTTAARYVSNTCRLQHTHTQTSSCQSANVLNTACLTWDCLSISRQAYPTQMHSTYDQWFSVLGSLILYPVLDSQMSAHLATLNAGLTDEHTSKGCQQPHQAQHSPHTLTHTHTPTQTHRAHVGCSLQL